MITSYPWNSFIIVVISHHHFLCVGDGCVG